MSANDEHSAAARARVIRRTGLAILCALIAWSIVATAVGFVQKVL